MKRLSHSLPHDLASRWHSLLALLQGHERVAVAFSGGVDSSLLLAAAVAALGPDNVLALMAVSPTVSASERADAEAVARALGIVLQLVPTDELSDPRFVSNPPDRCYHCKRILFSRFREIAAEAHALLVEGSNLDDDDDYRPGRQALAELGILSPLRSVRLTKADIRQLLQELGLPVWNKPSQACLASRFPVGTRITAEGVARVERAEAAVRGLGFCVVRVRSFAELAVVEVGAEELDRLFLRDQRKAVATAVREAGFARVAFAPEGYRTGSLNPT